MLEYFRFSQKFQSFVHWNIQKDKGCARYDTVDETLPCFGYDKVSFVFVIPFTERWQQDNGQDYDDDDSPFEWEVVSISEIIC